MKSLSLFEPCTTRSHSCSTVSSASRQQESRMIACEGPRPTQMCSCDDDVVVSSPSLGAFLRMDLLGPRQ